MVRLLAVLVLAGASVNAQTITETFGTGANQFSIDFVTIGNPGNEADTTIFDAGTGSPNPAGRVDYIYNLGKYEVSRDMITKANSIGSLEITISDMSGFGGNGINRPVTGVSWYEAAKFVNWLNTSTGGTAAYKFDGSGNFQLWSSTEAGYNPQNLFRNSLAKYFIPSSNEWYKGAYGSPGGAWYIYATGSDSTPTAVASGISGVVYNQDFSQGPADITNAGGLSAYGTMGQGGNVWEWNETSYGQINDTAGWDRELRGGSWHIHAPTGAWLRDFRDPTDEGILIGFRVASVPEPSSLSLLLAAGSVLVARRRKA